VQKYLQSESVGQALNETRSALASINVLKKICDHPALLTDKAANQALVASKRRKPGDVGSAAHDDESDDEPEACSGYDSTDSFIASDIEEEAGSTGDDESDSDSEESDDEAEEGGRRMKVGTHADGRARAAQIDGEVGNILSKLDAEFAGMSEDEVLRRLHRKQDKDSCKTVRFQNARQLQARNIACSCIWVNPNLQCQTRALIGLQKCTAQPPATPS
jgi:hypothetical protein